MQNRFTEGDDITWTHGAQTLKFGASVSRLQTNTYMPFRIGSTWAFAGLTGFLAGQPTVLSWTPLTIPAGLPGAGPAYANRDLRDIEFTPYVQDDWKISQKLTLNAGVRWAFITNPYDIHDQLYTITNFATSTNFSHVPHTFSENATWKNFDPRIGFAFDPFANHKTSIRGGIGIYHDLILPSNYVLVLLGPTTVDHVPGGTVGARQHAADLPEYPGRRKPAGNFEPWIRLQQSHHALRDPVQPERPARIDAGNSSHGRLCGLARGSPADAGGAEPPQTRSGHRLHGKHGQRFWRVYQCRQNSVATFGRVNTNLGSFPDFIPTTNSRYNSLQASVNRRFSHNVQAQVSYTWGKCTDDGSFVGSFNNNANASWGNPYNQHYDQSVCNYDITQSLRVSGMWALPFKRNRLVSGWQVSGIVASTTGLPFTVFQGIDSLGFGTGVVNPRPNFVGNGNPVTGNPGGLYFDPTAFTLAPIGTFGNSGRLSLRGPGFNNTDLAITKDTKIRENIGLQFRAEFFNLFNHVNWGVPIMGNGSANLYTAFVKRRAGAQRECG